MLRLVILSLLLVGCVDNQSTDSTILTIGAILPLSGPAAAWGEGMREGIELARKDLLQRGIQVEVLYEDSQGKSSEGISAYGRLKSERIDIVFTMLSTVTVPLIPIADNDQTPLLMTFVLANETTVQSEYAFRFFPTDKQIVHSQFEALLSKDRYKTISIVYVLDERGDSVRQEASHKASEEEIIVNAVESFMPGTPDFGTILTKLIEKESDAIVFIGGLEIIEFINQARELGINSDIVEMSHLLATPQIKEKIPDVGSTYSITFHSDVFTNRVFLENYNNHYEKDAWLPVTLGYDMLMLVANASEGKSIPSNILVKKLLEIKDVETLNGQISADIHGELSPSIYPVQIRSIE